MKLLLPGFTAAAFLSSAPFAAATLLVGFHDFEDGVVTSESADYIASGFSGSAQIVKDGDFSAGVGGSNDGTYGPATPGVPSVSGGDGFIRMNSSPTLLSVSNSGTNPFSLGFLLFDAVSVGLSPISVDYSVDGGGSWSTPASFTPSTPAGPGTAYQNYSDFAFDLGGLNLGVGGTVLFRFDSSNAARLDNIALVAIPETGGVLALSVLCISGLLFRQRRSSVGASAEMRM